MTRKYFISEKSKNWIDSEKACRELDGHLASIHTKGENVFVKSMLMSSYSYWIGLTDVYNEGNFSWTDGSAVDFTDWLQGNPGGGRTKNCVHYFYKAKSQKWNDAPCYIEMKYICKRSGKSMID